MSHGVTIAHAARIARRVPESCTTTSRVNERGKLSAELTVDVKEARLRQGSAQDVRVLLYEVGNTGPDGDPKPIPTESGRRAYAIPLTVHPKKGEDTVNIRVDVHVPDHEGTWVDVVVERVPSKRVPIAIAIALVATVLIASWLLGVWGDPSARKGHYEGKTPEEIQKDLNADVAWHSMEISVASRVAMVEGSTSCELRVENVEANHCDQKIRVWETGKEDDVLYESGAIAPGEYLQWVELAHALPVGTHTLTVQFQGYEQSATLLSDEGQLLGHDTFGASCAAEVVVEVLPVSE